MLVNTMLVNTMLVNTMLVNTMPLYKGIIIYLEIICYLG
jgi:hypothetical protein